jgi:16S rRNA (cytidine1402-2'-O)-methyltransferase
LLLKRVGISTPMLSNHGFNERARVQRLLEILGEGDVALVTDSGTPAISDPGAILVRAAAGAGFRVIPVPGPSALAAAVSASGLVDGPFTFLGFLPRASGERVAALETGLRSGLPLVIYESAHRILRLVDDLAEFSPDRELAVFRELTKVHEDAYRGRADSMPAALAGATLKGEFVVVVGPGREEIPQDLDVLISQHLEAGERPTAIARDVAKQTGANRSDVYARLLELSKAPE